MTEVYVNGSDRTACLYVPADIIPLSGTMEVTIDKNDEAAPTIINTVVADGEGKFTITIPFSLLQEDGELEINWSFNYIENGVTSPFSSSSYVSVVTPYLPIREIKEMLVDEDDFTDDDIRDIERATRHIINAYTGQSFGHTTATINVRGNGKGSLELPARLIRMDAMNGLENSGQFYQIRGEGFYLAGPPNGVPPIRGFNPITGVAPNPEDLTTPVWVNAPVISSPYSPGTNAFEKNANYAITGEWGWRRVPYKVQEATRLLINDYATGDTVYRDRYLTSMTAADWRIQFHSGAFLHTGNVRADQLLNDYVLQRGWMVL